jgi:DNA-binding CsgD family transcriptional regulator
MHEEWVRPQRWSHVVTARLWAEPGWRGGLIGGRVRPPSLRRRTPIAVLEQLVPHVRGAIEAWRQLDQVQGLAAVSADVLDVLPIAIVLVDPRTVVTSMNRAAEALMDIGRDPQWDGGRLRFTSDEATGRLRAACAEGATASFVVPRSGRAPLEVLVSPLLADAQGVMAVVLGDRERVPAIEPDALRAAYGLTPAQATLAAFLAQGFSLEDAAAHLAVTIGTVRDRVKQVFARTGTRSQADLVRLVLTGPGLVQRPSGAAGSGAPFGPLFLADVLGGRLVRRYPSFEG